MTNWHTSCGRRQASSASRTLCLDPHDLVVSKLAAGREKDFEFAAALLRAGLVDAGVLRERAEILDTVPAVRRRVVEWIDAFKKRAERHQLDGGGLGSASS